MQVPWNKRKQRRNEKMSKRKRRGEEKREKNRSTEWPIKRRTCCPQTLIKLFASYTHIRYIYCSYTIKLNKWKPSKIPSMLLQTKLRQVFRFVLFLKRLNSICIPSFQEVVSGASAESNKEKAKDSSNTVGERVGAGVDYVKDKCDEAGHAASKEVNKQKATH